jgi:hydrogenase maturation protein HypF
VAPDTELIGLLLPYTPLHELLLAAAGRPLVMTSGNRSDEPMATDDDDAVERLAGIADRFLAHDRRIAARCDDSVARVIAGAPTLLRRARGWVPRAITLPSPVKEPILACGAQLKNTFCIAVDNQAVLGPHVGDLDHLEAFTAYEEAIDRLERFLGVRPAIVAHDLHLDFLSPRYAQARAGTKFGVQHHHAHAAAALAEHGLERALALCWDGTGLGPDGTAWGGELLLVTPRRAERIATFRPVCLAGGERAIREPWRVALALLDDALPDAPIDVLLPGIEPAAIEQVRHLLAAGVSAPKAHGVGRFFDGAAALILRRHHARYEGQLAMALEAAADPWEHAHYPFALDRTRSPWRIDLRDAVRALVHDKLAGTPARLLAARWHETLREAGAAVVRLALARYGSMPIVGTGGCFQNARLAAGLRASLGGRLLLHREVPPGDGGIALGQVVVAAAAIANTED